MLITELENLTYIPLSSFVILLVIILTCASRRKKVDPFGAMEQSIESDIKGDYAIMCFPCLKKKPELKDVEPKADLSDQFEYIVEKYTIKKVPLLLANTAEDIIERQEELEMVDTQQSQPQLLKDEFVNFQMAQEVYNVQRVPPCITVAANTVCPGRKVVKERAKPCDVLESMSPVPRPSIKNPNYVVIPTKGSLRNKDIMMTKREITNQYLNNFSSVFVDNLKDQVPKDPEQFPNLSRPYTSAFRNLPIAETFLKTPPTKKIKRGKTQKVAYSFPADDINLNEDASVKEEEPYYDSDTASKDQTTDAPESEFQEDNENETADLTDKSKSVELMNDSDSAKEVLDGAANPFKTTIKSSASEFDHNIARSVDYDYQSSSFASRKDEWPNTKVTYEDIQALDVGYEFKSCEKLGVKPKMTRIHYPHEGDRTKDLKQTGDSKSSRRSFFTIDQQASQISSSKASRNLKPKQHQRASDVSFYANLFSSPKEKNSSRSLLTETSFLPKIESSVTLSKRTLTEASMVRDLASTTTFTSKSEDSKSQSLNDIDLNPCASEAINDSVAEISKLYDLAIPVSRNSCLSTNYGPQVTQQSDDIPLKLLTASKSRSFQEPGRTVLRKENACEVKGKDFSPICRVDEPETETSCSVLSRDSKTSSAVTSPRSSERDEGKRATLRWKIVIKHHRDENSRKNVNKNIKL